MKNLALMTVVVVFAAIVLAAIPKSDLMPIEEAAKRWGVISLDAVKFKKGDEKTRASMAVSLYLYFNMAQSLLQTTYRNAYGNA